MELMFKHINDLRTFRAEFFKYWNLVQNINFENDLQVTQQIQTARENFTTQVMIGVRIR